MKPITILARGEDIFSRHAAGGADREVVHADKLPDERANRLGFGRELQPVVERADFVGFKVTLGNVPESCGINQCGDGFAQGREHAPEGRVPWSGVKPEARFP